MENQPLNLGTKFIMEGFVYNKSRDHNVKLDWDCTRLYQQKYGTRAVTALTEPEQKVTVLKRPSPEDHNHPVNHDETEIEIFKEGKHYAFCIYF